MSPDWGEQRDTPKGPPESFGGSLRRGGGGGVARASVSPSPSGVTGGTGPDWEGRGGSRVVLGTQSEPLTLGTSLVTTPDTVRGARGHGGWLLSLLGSLLSPPLSLGPFGGLRSALGSLCVLGCPLSPFGVSPVPPCGFGVPSGGFGVPKVPKAGHRGQGRGNRGDTGGSQETGGHETGGHRGQGHG